MLLDIKLQVNGRVIIVSVFNNPHSLIDRTSQQKMERETSDLKGNKWT